MRYAHQHRTGEFRWENSGGDPTNTYLENLGFEITNKDEAMESNYTWVPVHKQIAEKLLEYEHRQDELIELLQDIGIGSVDDRA